MRDPTHHSKHAEECKKRGDGALEAGEGGHEKKNNGKDAEECRREPGLASVAITKERLDCGKTTTVVCH
jgi:hypothetical protein